MRGLTILIRKELRELGPPMLLNLVAIAVGWFALAKFEQVWLAPSRGPVVAVVAIAAVMSGVLGWGQFASERWRATHNFLVHRGTGRRGAFIAKAIVGAAISWSLAALPPILFALYVWLLTPNGALIHFERVGELAIVACVALPCYAAGVLAGADRRAGGFAVVLALLGSAGAALAAMRLDELALAAHLPWIGAILSPISIAAPLVWFAWARFEREDYLDVAASNSLAIASAVAAVALIVWPVARVGSYAREFTAPLTELNARIVRSRASGECFAIERVPDVGWRRQDGRPYGGMQTGLNVWNPWGQTPDPDLQSIFGPGVASGAWEPSEELGDSPSDTSVVSGANWARVHAPSSASHSNEFVEAFLDRERGCLRWIERFAPEYDPARTPVEVVLGKPGGGGFSDASLEVHSCENASLIFDPADASLWRLTDSNGEPQLAQLELPSGDRLRGLEALYSRDSAEIGAYWQDRSWGPLIVGEHGRYVVRNGIEDFDAIPIEPSTDDTDTKPVRADEVASRARYRVVTLDSDPFEPRFELRERSDDRLLCSLRAEPPSAAQTWSRRAIAAATFLIPTYSSVIAFMSPADARYHAIDEEPTEPDPLFAGGRRAGLLLAILVMSLALAGLAFKRLRARGANRVAASIWAAVVATFGLPAFVAFRLLQPSSGAPRDLEHHASSSESRAELLIRSA